MNSSATADQEKPMVSGFKETVLGFLTAVTWLVCTVSVHFEPLHTLLSFPFLMIGLWLVLKLTRGKARFGDYLVGAWS